MIGTRITYKPFSLYLFYLYSFPDRIGFARKLQMEEYGLPAFKSAFREAAQIDPAAADDLYTFDTVIASFAIDAGLLQIVGISGVNPDDPCQDGIGEHDAIMATVATSGLFTN